MDQGPATSQRYERDRAFHNECFAEGLRGQANRFLAVDVGRRELFKRLKPERPGLAALDYGCGQGGLTVALEREGYDVTAVDLSEEAIRQTRECGVKAELHVMNAEALEFPDDSFDLVCGKAILHHLDLSSAYAEVARVLKPDGRALFLEPLAHNALINLYRKRTSTMRTPDEHPLLLDDVRKAGDYFTRGRVDFYDLFTLAAFPLRGTSLFNPVMAILEKLDRAVLRTPLRRYAWLVLLELREPKGRAA